MPSGISYFFNGKGILPELVSGLISFGELPAGQVDFNHTDPLGKGCYGGVYPAYFTPEVPGQSWVIKKGSLEDWQKASLEREAHFFQQVHDSPVQLVFVRVSVGSASSYYMMLSKRILGQNFFQYLLKSKASPLEILKVLDAVFVALKEQLHDKGFFHGDLKPANIMIGPTGEVSFVDFGWSYREDESATRMNCEEGYGKYWHPSRREGEGEHLDPSPYQDIYSLAYALGVVFSKMEKRFSGLFAFLKSFCSQTDSFTVAQVRDAIQVEQGKVALKECFSHYPSFSAVLIACGEGSARELLRTLSESISPGVVLPDEFIDEVWQVYCINKLAVEKRRATARELAQLVGDGFTELLEAGLPEIGDWKPDRELLKEAAIALQQEVVFIAYSHLLALGDVDPRIAPVCTFYEEKLEHTHELADWQRLEEQLAFLRLLVTAFKAYEAASKTVNPDCQNYVFNLVELHGLEHLCKLVACCDRLEKHSFFTKVLESAKTLKLRFLLESFLVKNGLEECFEQSLYKETAGKVSYGVFTLTAQRVRDKILAVVQATVSRELDTVRCESVGRP